MDYTQMTGRELLIANEAHQNEPAFRTAFMAAILAGKFQGMTQGCFNGIRKEALA
jgi:hypothetical protein